VSRTALETRLVQVGERMWRVVGTDAEDGPPCPGCGREMWWHRPYGGLPRGGWSCTQCQATVIGPSA
jgi:ribosomal protein L37AE/L43A